MPFINYDTHNYCIGCDYRFLKLKGIRCPQCKRRGRSHPRATKYERLVSRV